MHRAACFSYKEMFDYYYQKGYHLKLYKINLIDTTVANELDKLYEDKNLFRNLLDRPHVTKILFHDYPMIFLKTLKALLFTLLQDLLSIC